jgi:ribosomal protein S12 methylthiotransferase accessory factor YcaO
MMHYRYTHTSTEATTGYFACEPQPEMALADALRYLAEHPLDDFMRRHLLNRMSGQNAASIRKLFDSSFGQEPLPPAIMALAEELALLRPELRELADLGPDPTDKAPPASSLVFLRWQKLPDRQAHQAWVRAFNANIQQHRALKPLPEMGLPPLFADAEGQGGPGSSAAFTAPFPVRLEDIIDEHRERLDPTAPAYQRPPAAQTSALAEERLLAQGVIAGPEMRHTASLSPIALLRPWNIKLGMRQGRHEFSLDGQATTYGRGLSLPDARASCLMEMVERASAYLSVDGATLLNTVDSTPLVRGSRSAVIAEHGPAIDPNDYPLEAPYSDEELVWMAGVSPVSGPVYVPVQMVGLFCNCDEIALFDSPGSTGIATGCTMEEARVAALQEILERDAEATTPFSKASCFRLEADPERDPAIAALLADYAALGINVQFQELTGPMGVPVFKCFVMSLRGAISRGHGAGLSARRAIVSALTETPFPYPEGGPSGPMLRKLPARRLHELADFSLPTPAANLALLEDLLLKNGREPVYVDLTRPDLAFPVTRALIPGMELAADRDAFSRVPRRLYENYLRLFEIK